MTEEERRKVFWLIKKYSSYTAWEALAAAYYAFADAWMVAMRTASDADIDEFNQGATRDILDGRIGFEKGLPQLKVGDRSVWRRSRARSFASWGHLTRGMFQIGFIQKIHDPAEYVFDWMKNKNDVLAKKSALLFWAARLGVVTERLEAKHPAPMSPYDALQTVHPDHGYAMNDPGYLNFPPTLPTVPAPTGTTADTGGEVPVDGIYEPEWGHIESVSPTGLLGKMRTAFGSKPSLVNLPTGISPRREHLGCMNYLLANTSAPSYQDRELDQPMPVTWRLIWQDERYLDGVIPLEEAEYLAPAAAPATDTAQLRCEAGLPCPREGWWFSPAKPDSRRHFAHGEVMPAFSTDYGGTIWQWDKKQGT